MNSRLSEFFSTFLLYVLFVFGFAVIVVSMAFLAKTSPLIFVIFFIVAGCAALAALDVWS